MWPRHRRSIPSTCTAAIAGSPLSKRCRWPACGPSPCQKRRTRRPAKYRCGRTVSRPAVIRDRHALEPVSDRAVGIRSRHREWCETRPSSRSRVFSEYGEPHVGATGTAGISRAHVWPADSVSRPVPTAVPSTQHLHGTDRGLRPSRRFFDCPSRPPFHGCQRLSQPEAGISMCTTVLWRRKLATGARRY